MSHSDVHEACKLRFLCELQLRRTAKAAAVARITLSLASRGNLTGLVPYEADAS